MKLFLLSLALCAKSAGAQTLADAAGKAAPELVKLYERLHAAPELSFQEKKTSEAMARELRAAGFQVTQGLGRYPKAGLKAYGVVGVLRNGAGPTVLIRTDMDALPVTERTGLPFASKVSFKNESGETVGVMHACGHDIHMASWVGAARQLAASKAQWAGTLVFVAQPAEEMGAGSEALLADGLYERFPKPDFAVALHANPLLAAGKIGYREGYALAGVDDMDIVVRGKGGHGAFPHAAKDPIVLAAEAVLALQTLVSRENPPLEPAVLTIGSIHGGTKHNIIPDEVRLQLTIRAFKPQVRERLLAGVERMMRGLAAAAGAPEPLIEKDKHSVPPLYNEPLLTRRLTGVLQAELGAANVEASEPVMGAEDFTRYALEGKIPAAMFWVGVADPAATKAPAPLHSPLFSSLPEPGIRTGVRALTAAALDLLKKPS